MTCRDKIQLAVLILLMLALLGVLAVGVSTQGH
jgi:hypothetical protein